MALLTPELAADLLASLALLQGPAGPTSVTSKHPERKTSAPPTPTEGGTGTATPRMQNPATPRPEPTGSVTPKSRSRSPSARADATEPGSRLGGFTIKGLVALQKVLGIAAGMRPDLIPVADEEMSDL